MSVTRPFWEPDLEAMPGEQFPAYQDRLVREAVAYAYEHTREGYRRLNESHIDPKTIRGVDDLPRIPLLPKAQLPDLQAEDPPFGGMLAVPITKLRRVYLSPGPILDPEGDESDYWHWAPALWAAGFRPGDIVHNTFAYHLTPAGAMMEEGLRLIGAVVLPGGVGNSEWQLDLMERARATGYVGTPSFLLSLMEKARARGTSLSLKRAFVSSAPLPPSLRQTLQEDYGLDVYQGYGTADAGCIGYECNRKEGWHIVPNMVVEVVDPATGQPVPPGETGEVVITRPDSVYPLVRLATGDLSAWHTEPCTCGRTSPRLVGFLGRVGEGVKVRGMFVHPRQLRQALGRQPGVNRYQGVVTREHHRDELTIRVEPEPGASLDAQALAQMVRDIIKLRVNVVVVPPGTLKEDERVLVDERVWE